MMKIKIAVACLAAWTVGAVPAGADQIKLGSVCRVKGQEERVIQGLGVVVGLPGTGDGSLATTRQSIKQLLDRMGNPVGAQGLRELKDFKNVALVVVTATIPASGARQGDKIDCVVSSFGAAKSLKGGRLLETALAGPGQPPDLPVYAFAQGSIDIEDSNEATGRIHGGCRMEEDFFNPFIKDGKITLVLNNNHSGFGAAQGLAERINGQSEYTNVPRNQLAKAIDQNNIEVSIPEDYKTNPVMFLADILDLEVYSISSPAEVRINQRTGTIVMTADVEIGAAVITQKNFVVEAGATQSTHFVGIDPSEREATKLRALLDALKAVHAPTDDIIDIIKELARSKRLHAKLVIE